MSPAVEVQSPNHWTAGKSLDPALLFACFWLCWIFFAVCRFSLDAENGGYSLLRCRVFSLR